MIRPTYVYGQVTSMGKAVDGAIVSAENAGSVNTNSAGCYLMCIPSGTYDMAVFKDGYQPFRIEDVIVQTGGFIRISFDIIP